MRSNAIYMYLAITHLYMYDHVWSCMDCSLYVVWSTVHKVAVPVSVTQLNISPSGALTVKGDLQQLSANDNSWNMQSFISVSVYSFMS